MSDHADLEALSAFVDGEAPEWAAHVGSCAACQATVDELRAVARAVAAPVEPPAAGAGDAAVAAALAAVPALDAVATAPTAPTVPSVPLASPAPPPGPGDGHGHGAERARSARRRSDWHWALPAVAALVAAVLGLSALLTTKERPAGQTTLAGPALESAPEAGALSDAKATSGGSGVGVAAPPADLGDVPDAATLAARVSAVGGAGNPGRAASAANSGASPSGGAAASAGSSAAAPRAVAPNVVGTRPCEEQARSREPALREVVYFATARRGQTEAVVLGFASSSAPTPVILLMLAQDGCRELLRAAVP